MIRSHRMPSVRPAALFGLLALLLCFPGDAAAGAAQGVTLCAEQLIPSLLPFMVVCEWLMRDPDAHRVGAVCVPLARAMGCRAPTGGTVLLLSWLGGFAASARTIGIAYRAGQLTRREAEALLPGCIAPSPAFILVTVGGLMLGRPRLGTALLAAVFGANLLCGVLIGQIWHRLPQPLDHTPTVQHREAPASGFAAAAGSSAQSMLVVCALVVFFSAVSGVCARLLPGESGRLPAILLEMTNGCRVFAASDILRAEGCCAALSWLGVSALVQVRALLPQEISLTPLIAARAVHLPCALLLLQLFLRLLPGETAAFSSLPPQVFPMSRTAPDAAFVLFLLCCVTLHRLERTA